MKKMNVLFLNEIPCFPPNTGEKLRSYNLLHSILEFSDSLHLISGNAPPSDEAYIKVKYYPIPENFHYLNRWKNLKTLFIKNKQLVKTIEGVLNREKIDVAILDYDFLGNYISIFRKRNIKVIYGTHNVQSFLNNQYPGKGFKNSVYKKTRFTLERLHEDRFFPRADAILCVSENDKSFYETRYRKSRTYVIPNYINEKIYELKNPPARQNQIIMAANYSAFQNRHGLEWFIKNVWDQELASMTRFIIAGHESERELERFQKMGWFTSNAIALGSVPDMKVHIAGSKVAIIPLLHGSGTRLKCIEAMALKTNIVSTTIGVEGIDHKGSIILADRPSEFKEKLIKVLNGEIRNEEKAYNLFINEYSSKANTLKLKEIFLNT